MNPRRLVLCLVIACLGLIFGCGPGSQPRLISSNVQSASGRATFTMIWPQRTRLIPQAANSIVVRIQNGATVLASQTLARPTNGGPATVSFPALPTGQLTAPG